MKKPMAATRSSKKVHSAGAALDDVPHSELDRFLRRVGRAWLEDSHSETSAVADVSGWLSRRSGGGAGHLSDVASAVLGEALERFLITGRSPSAVSDAFRAFRSWLIEQRRNGTLPPIRVRSEVDDLLERLATAHEELTRALVDQALLPIFSQAEDEDISHANFALYRQAADRAGSLAEDAVSLAAMKPMRGARSNAGRKIRERIRAAVEADVDALAPMRALAMVQAQATADTKLDRKWLIDRYGQTLVAALPANATVVGGGANADDLAEMAGFATADDLVMALSQVEAETRALRQQGECRELREALTEVETSAASYAYHGDPVADGTIADEAVIAAHNDDRGEVLAMELSILADRSGEDAPTYAETLAWARARIASETIGHITAGIAATRYGEAAAETGKAAVAAIGRGDFAAAFHSKRGQMINNALIAEAARAGAGLEAALRSLRRFGTARHAGAIESTALDQIHALLDQVDLRDDSLPPADPASPFARWAALRTAEGYDIVVPPSFAEALSDTPWRRLTVRQGLDLERVVRQIAHIGRTNHVDGRSRPAADIVRTTVEHLKTLSSSPAILTTDTLSDALAAGSMDPDVALSPVRQTVAWLDGQTDGVFHREVLAPVVEARDRARTMTLDCLARLSERLDEVPAADIARWNEKMRLPELASEDMPQGRILSRQQLVAVALNMANADTMRRLARGNGWRPDAIVRVLDRTLSSGEWRFVGHVWDITSGLWPILADSARRINGIALLEPEPLALHTRSGLARGGYFPAIHDGSLHPAPAEIRMTLRGLFGTSYTRATAPANPDAPILLQIGSLARHLGEVIHDIVLRPVIMDAVRFLMDVPLARAMDDLPGSPRKTVLLPWLATIAGEWAIERDALTSLGNFVNETRFGAIVTGSGYRLATLIVRIGGYGKASAPPDERWLAPAILAAVRDPDGVGRFARRRSAHLDARYAQLDDAVSTALRSLAEDRSSEAEVIRFALHCAHHADRLITSASWTAAYNRAFARSAEEATAATEADDLAGAAPGGAALLEAIRGGKKGGGELLRLAAFFQDHMSAAYLQDLASAQEDGVAKAKPGEQATLFARALWTTAIPPVLGQILAGDGPGNAEDWGLWAFRQSLRQALAPLPIRWKPPTLPSLAGDTAIGRRPSPLQRMAVP